MLRVVRGEPAPEELAALVAVVTARAAAPGESGETRLSAWRDPSRLVRQPVFAGPGAWRASARPR
jgi:hypothetical protein